MNRIITLILVSCIISCIGKHDSDAQQASISDKELNSNVRGDTVLVNLSKSVIYWKGTKMRGAGKHEGTIQLQEAYLQNRGKHISGGSFTVNMKTIAITDIPAHEPIPRKRLKDHLSSTDFFNVSDYPTSYFKITKVVRLKDNRIRIKGNLTIKGITKNIEFMALYKHKLLSAKFTFDRFQWNIAYKGDWLDKTLVDKDIELNIKLKTR